jgi:hypothetical protein
MANLPGFTATASGSGFVEFKADGTYHYTPDYSIEISLNGMTGTGQWSGTLDGTWSLADTNFVMGQTSNNLTGSVSLGGSELPMPTNRTFSGTAAIVSCQPETLTYEMNSPLGLLRTTLLRVS